MLHAITTGAFYPHVDTTWKILTTGASLLTAGALCSVQGVQKKSLNHQEPAPLVDGILIIINNIVI